MNDRPNKQSGNLTGRLLHIRSISKDVIEIDLVDYDWDTRIRERMMTDYVAAILIDKVDLMNRKLDDYWEKVDA